AHFVARVVGVYLPDALWPNELNEAVFTVCVLVFYCSARLYRRLPIPYKSVAVAALVGVAWSVAYAHGIVSVPAVEAAVLIFFLIGYTFWEEGRKQESRVDVLLAVTFGAWGLLAVFAFFQSRLPFLQGNDVLPMILLPELFTCVLMVMAVYEEERRRVERNMLALSNLNLATSSVVGGEIQKMLAQALDRVLNVVRIPAGALFMHDAEA